MSATDKRSTVLWSVLGLFVHRVAFSLWLLTLRIKLFASGARFNITETQRLFKDPDTAQGIDWTASRLGNLSGFK